MTKLAHKEGHLEVPTLPRQSESVGILEHWIDRRSKLIKFSIANSEFSISRDDQSLLPSLEPTPVPKLPYFSPVPQRAESFAALQEWEGIVTEIKDGAFFARLIDVTADETEPNEVAELSIEDLQEEDVPRLKTGAIFRWVIGYAKSAAGTKTRGSRIYFRRTLSRRQTPVRDLIFEK